MASWTKDMEEWSKLVEKTYKELYESEEERKIRIFNKELQEVINGL